MRPRGDADGVARRNLPAARTVLHSENTRALTARFARRAEPWSDSRERCR